MEKRVWVISCTKNGFTFKILLRTLEESIREYMHTELTGLMTSYSGATEKEIEAGIILGLPIYCY